MQTGVEAFIQDMTELGFEATVEAELVIYRVVAVDGVHAGLQVETGVGISELQPWPQVPPHWLHFPRWRRIFAVPTASPSPKSEWLMHSRQITGWGDAPAGVAWASHVRAVLSESSCVMRHTSVAMTEATEEALVRQACSRRRSRRHQSCDIPALHRPHPFPAPLFARLSRLSLGIALSTEMQPLLPATSCGPQKWPRKMTAVWSYFTATQEPASGSL